MITKYSITPSQSQIKCKYNYNTNIHIFKENIDDCINIPVCNYYTYRIKMNHII